MAKRVVNEVTDNRPSEFSEIPSKVRKGDSDAGLVDMSIRVRVTEVTSGKKQAHDEPSYYAQVLPILREWDRMLQANWDARCQGKRIPYRNVPDKCFGISKWRWMAGKVGLTWQDVKRLMSVKS